MRGQRNRTARQKVKIEMPKKEPVRKCVACGEQKPKQELLRIVRQTDGNVVVDSTGKMNGRGAYLCKKRECLEKAVKKNRLKAALKTQISEDFYEELKHIIEN